MSACANGCGYPSRYLAHACVPPEPERPAEVLGVSNAVDPYIATYGGGIVHLLHPEPEEMHPDVIAHSLALLCRYTGHVDTFYSVAQHCVMVSQVVPEQYALDGLLHDATEAFMGDLSRPLKVALDSLAPGVVSGFEDNLHRALSVRYGVAFPLPPEVKVGDNIALATEMRDLMGREVTNLPDPLPGRIIPWDPERAEWEWLQRFEEVTE